MCQVQGHRLAHNLLGAELEAAQWMPWGDWGMPAASGWSLGSGMAGLPGSRSGAATCPEGCKEAEGTSMPLQHDAAGGRPHCMCVTAVGRLVSTTHWVP